MSGGVDSSVAASLLRDQGYECIGVFMRVGRHAPAEDSCPAPAGDGAAAPRRLRHGCCSAADAIDARAVAGRLGLPFYALDFEDDFDEIIEYFVSEYAVARTPNPCIVCNIRLKFGKLLRWADMMDAEFVATGHYARVIPAPAELASEPGRWALARARNLAKDQSYVLFGIQRDDLARCLFPLGEIAAKDTVRAIAAELGLRVHDKPDSQEICFVPGNDYRRLVRRRRPEAFQPGEVRDCDGRVLGSHAGVAGFTIGQRRGLGIAAGVPIYVTRLDPETNTVTVGRRADLLSAGLVAERVNWLGDPPTPGTSRRVSVKIRHMHTPAPAVLRVRASGSTSPPAAVQAMFDTPQPAVTPGQAAVFYAGDVVLGGGWIRSASRS